MADAEEATSSAPLRRWRPLCRNARAREQARLWRRLRPLRQAPATCVQATMDPVLTAISEWLRLEYRDPVLLLGAFVGVQDAAGPAAMQMDDPSASAASQRWIDASQGSHGPYGLSCDPTWLMMSDAKLVLLVTCEPGMRWDGRSVRWYVDVERQQESEPVAGFAEDYQRLSKRVGGERGLGWVNPLPGLQALRHYAATHCQHLLTDQHKAHLLALDRCSWRALACLGLLLDQQRTMPLHAPTAFTPQTSPFQQMLNLLVGVRHNTGMLPISGSTEVASQGCVRALRVHADDAHGSYASIVDELKQLGLVVDAHYSSSFLGVRVTDTVQEALRYIAFFMTGQWGLVCCGSHPLADVAITRCHVADTSARISAQKLGLLIGATNARARGVARCMTGWGDVEVLLKARRWRLKAMELCRRDKQYHSLGDDVLACVREVVVSRSYGKEDQAVWNEDAPACVALQRECSRSGQRTAVEVVYSSTRQVLQGLLLCCKWLWRRNWRSKDDHSSIRTLELVAAIMRRMLYDRSLEAYTDGLRSDAWHLYIQLNAVFHVGRGALMELCSEGLEELRGGQWYDVKARQKRLGSASNWTTPKSGSPTDATWRTVYIGARIVKHGNRAGRRIMFDGERNVEEVALMEYEKLGWNGMFSECRVFLSLLRLLLWDQIFDTTVKGVWCCAHDVTPLDLLNHGGAFARRRRKAIDRRLAELERMTKQRLGEEIEHAWDRQMDVMSVTALGGRWLCHGLTKRVACHIGVGLGSALINPILSTIIEDISAWVCGLPDLILWAPAGAVKGELSTVDPRRLGGVQGDPPIDGDDMLLTPEDQGVGQKGIEEDVVVWDVEQEPEVDEDDEETMLSTDDDACSEAAMLKPSAAVEDDGPCQPVGDVVVKLVEVKSERDELSPAQRAWIGKLNVPRRKTRSRQQADADLFELCKVVSSHL